ncbi:MAG: anti-sigma F factor [Christensenellales bacterium]
MKVKNEMTMIVKAISENESFVRSSVASFCLPLNPTLDEITEIKTAVSEAVTNCVVHAYPNKVGDITIKVKLTQTDVHISITDHGVGIDNLEKAIEPFFTTKPEEDRSGMGFTVIESFMDSFKLERNKGKGVTVYMTKHIGSKKMAMVGENNAVSR